jgi:phenylalanyl-tRNA synthetase beta chain
MGPRFAEQWGASAIESVDFFDVKADLEALFDLCGRGSELSFSEAKHPSLHPGQTAEIRLGGSPVGWLGMLHPSLEKALGFERAVFLFDVDLDLALRRSVPHFRPLSKFPQVRRDLAVVVDATVRAEQITACVRAAGENLIRQVTLFDVYSGSGVEPGRKSIAFGLILQADDETLTDARVEHVIDSVVDRLKIELAAELRT